MMDKTPKTKANVKQAVPFFWVNDMDTSLQFYVAGLGGRVTDKWVDDGKLRWCWLELGGAPIMLQKFWKEGHHANMPTGKLGEGLSIYFICEDALAFYKAVTGRGIQASEPFVGNGMWVTSLTDPDGYRLDFASYTDVAEETTYSEWSAE